jgi:hypothetical protein
MAKQVQIKKYKMRIPLPKQRPFVKKSKKVYDRKKVTKTYAITSKKNIITARAGRAQFKKLIKISKSPSTSFTGFKNGEAAKANAGREITERANNFVKSFFIINLFRFTF